MTASSPPSKSGDLVEILAGGLCLAGSFFAIAVAIRIGQVLIEGADNPGGALLGFLLFAALGALLASAAIAMWADGPEPTTQSPSGAGNDGGNRQQRTSPPSSSTNGSEGFCARVKEFFDDLRDTAGMVDVEQLPADLINPIKPLLPAGERYLSHEQFRALYVEATRLMAAREEFARQEIETITRQTELKQTRARARYLNSLTTEERALLEINLQTKADADARAARDCARMERQIASLRRRLAEIDEELLCARAALAAGRGGLRPWRSS